MQKNKSQLLLWFGFCFLSLLVLSSCSDIYEYNYKETDLDDSPNLVQEAYTWVKKLQHPPQFLNLDFHKDNEENARAVSSDNIDIDWSSYRTFEHNGYDIAIVPITNDTKSAFVQLTEHGRARRNLYKVNSKLIIRRNKSNKEMSIVVGTYICDYSYYKNNYDELSSLSFYFNGTNFNGYFITSRLDGSMLSGKHIRKGKVKFSFRPNPLPVSERKKSIENSYAHLYLNLKPFTISSSIHSRNSVNPEQEEIGVTRCSSCFELFDDCTCFIVNYCKDCGLYIEDCTCNDNICELCGQTIILGECACCPICHKFHCECMMNNGSGVPCGGGSSGSGNNRPEVSYKNGYICIGFQDDVLDKDDFSPYQDSDNRGCFDRCKEMLAEVGCEVDGGDIRMTENDESTGRPIEPSDTFQEGIDEINETLDKGKPIILNVDYKEGKYSRDGAGDHFIIVVGKAVINGNTYYHFYDPATSHVNTGTQNTNVLYIKDGYLSGSFIKRNDSGVNNYKVTSVRTNK